MSSQQSDQSTLSSEVFPVRTSQTPTQKAKGSRARARDSGRTSPVLLAELDPSGSSWRTYQGSFGEEWIGFSEILPYSGTMRSGRLFQRRSLVRRTSDGGYGLWPTPTAKDASERAYQVANGKRYDTLVGAARRYPTPTAEHSGSNRSVSPNAAERPSLETLVEGEAREERELWPTPTAADSNRGYGMFMRGNETLEGAVKGRHIAKAIVETGMSIQEMFPTPKANDHKHPGRPRDSKTAVTSGLAARVIWPTITAQDAKNNGGASQYSRRSRPLNASVGGKLNPRWVEWLMGFPVGWTRSAVSAMRSSRKRRGT